LTSTTNLLFNQHDARKCYTSDFHWMLKRDFIRFSRFDLLVPLF
jgi:hypothetical protein